jgi:hypothetical protein
MSSLPWQYHLLVNFMNRWVDYARMVGVQKVQEEIWSCCNLSLSYIGSHYDALAAPGSAIPLVTGNSLIQISVFCWNPEKDRHTCRIIMNITVLFSYLATCKTYRMKVYTSSIELPCSSVYSYISMCSEFGSWNSGRGSRASQKSFWVHQV